MARHVDRFAFERKLLEENHSPIAGVDEAGRGPLAGPVLAAAVMLPESWIHRGLPEALRGLNDSKQLTSRQREDYFAALISLPEVRYSIAEETSTVIDTVNILQATHRAMNKALATLPSPPHHVLVDGNRVPSMILPQTPLVHGDSRSYSIAAASILAKVTRDRMMEAYDKQWPAYGFAAHKGYGTPQHLDALARLGPCPIHRRSFAPLRPVTLELFGNRSVTSNR